MAVYALSLLVGLALAAATLLYRAARPKPIPGIPYLQRSADALWGDVPDAMKLLADTKCTFPLLEMRLEELQSPVIQLFLRPFGTPWVVVADARETVDILARRTREFDRSQYFVDAFRAILPHKVSMHTHDQWRFNRRLMADTMSSAFLDNVAAPQVYHSTQALVHLWREKARLAAGAPFDALADITECTVDTIWAAAFGADLGVCQSQGDFLATVDKLPPHEGPVVDMPAVAPPAMYTALMDLMHSVGIAVNSPLGYWHHLFAVKVYPRYRRAIRLKNQLVDAHMQAAWKKFGEGQSRAPIRSAADCVVQREVALAKKAGRAPDDNSKFIHDELVTFLGAGYETTSTAAAWGIKYLTKWPEIQARLRQSLKEAFDTLPAPEEIAKRRVPYLEAFIEEVLRVSGTLPDASRIATVDTQILGHHIPKGTNVFMMAIGPSITAPAFDIDEKVRSKTSQEFKGDTDRWVSENLEAFRPERWLVQGKSGELEFDGRAAPMHSFGGGIRACFGRKLAYLEMRVIFTLLVWHFEIKPPPGDLLDFKAEELITRRPQNCLVSLLTID